MADKIIFLNANSRLVRIPERVDVLVSDCTGHYVFGGNMISAVADIRDKFLKQDGCVMPNYISMYLVPVDSVSHYNYVNYWKGNLYGIDFTPAQKIANNNVYFTTFDAKSLICAPANICNINLSKDFPNEMMNVKVDFLIPHSCRMHGLCGWFDVRLCNRVHFSTSPYNKTTGWKQLFFPLEEEISLKKSSVVRVNLILRKTHDDTCACFAWNIKVIGSIEHKQRQSIVKRQSTRKSFLAVKWNPCKTKICDINKDGEERNAEFTEIVKQMGMKHKINKAFGFI